jgi:cell division protein FtsB
MTPRQNILLAFAILALFTLLFVIVFSKNGALDLYELKADHARMEAEIERINRANVALYREIDRLQNDLSYVESVARKELGMIKPQERILKLKD